MSLSRLEVIIFTVTLIVLTQNAYCLDFEKAVQKSEKSATALKFWLQATNL